MTALDCSGCDLSQDPLAADFQTRPVQVQVAFAEHDGSLQTLEGPVRYAAGAALLTAASGERWPVERAAFEARYQALAPGRYAKRPLLVRARQMAQDFSTRAGPQGDRLLGQPGDWLVQYGPGHHGVVAASRFAALYEAASRDRG